MCKNYYEDDRPVKVPQKYHKWSDKKIERVLSGHERWTKFKNRFKPGMQEEWEKLENKLGYKIYLFEDKPDD